MKTLKVKSIFFSLLAMMGVAIFMTSCEQQSMIIEETSETQILEEQLIAYVYGNTTYEVSTNEDGSLNRHEISEELQQLIDTKNIVKLGESNILHLFDSEDEVKDFIMDTTGSTQVIEKKSAKDSWLHVVVYKDYNAQGEHHSRSHNFNAPDMGKSYNNRISSCEILNSTNLWYIVEFYDRQNYGGPKLTLATQPYTNAYHPNLKVYAFDNRTKSMRGYSTQ